MLMSKESLMEIYIKQREDKMCLLNAKTLILEMEVYKLKINMDQQKEENIKMQMNYENKRIEQDKKNKDLELKIENFLDINEKQTNEIKEIKQELKDLIKKSGEQEK